MTPSLALSIGAAYIGLLFLIAFISDRRARRAGVRGQVPAWVFTLSISVYCTSWTFYGSVGLASRSGLEFTAIYLGPTLIFLGWWFLLRKIVRITKEQRLTSIADFISSRFGRSASVAAAATLIALIASTPYVALQLKAVATSFDLIAGRQAAGAAFWHDTAFWVAAAMALFAVLFGARSGTADEHYPGVISAIAFEAVVKLIALMGVGLFVVLHLRGLDWQSLISPADLQRITTLPDQAGGRWVSLLVLSAIAILCLPRQFQVTAVEAVDEGHFRTAAWLFPLYLLLISAFVIPIAVAGHVFVGADANPDQFVLTVPLALGNESMAMLAFIGGFSSATSMVIVASIALSIMVSNHILVPLVFRLAAQEGRAYLGRRLLTVRQGTIVFVLGIAFLYYRTAGQSDALAAMGLIAFVGVAQFFPPLLAAVFWRQAAERGALAALVIGGGLWAYTLLLPTLFPDAPWIEDGPFGLAMLRPQALLGAAGLDPVAHSLLWSLLGNALALALVSAYARRSPLEHLQERLFVDAFQQSVGAESRVWRRSAGLDELQVLAREVLGDASAKRLFAQSQNPPAGGQQATSALIYAVEQEMAATFGAATARRLVARVARGESLSMDDMAAILDQTQQALDQARALEEKSDQLQETARSLRQALVQLRRLDRFKDAFLAQVSHELRTPMTSLKAFTQILQAEQDLPPATRAKYLHIIAQEADRLTGLLDELLDVQQSTETTQRDKVARIALDQPLTAALDVFVGDQDAGRLHITLAPALADIHVQATSARLRQVFINLISNALKYASTEQRPLRVDIRGERRGDQAILWVSDTGPGIDPTFADSLFLRFTRDGAAQVPGSGLGLAICRQIMLAMNGSIDLATDQGPKDFGGACFELRLPLAEPSTGPSGAPLAKAGN